MKGSRTTVETGGAGGMDPHPLAEIHPGDNQTPEDAERRQGALREGKDRSQRSEGTRDERTPQGLTGTWEQSEGGNGDGTHSRDMEADAGMRRGEHRQAVEAGGWRVKATSRWTELCDGRGGGKRVQ